MITLIIVKIMLNQLILASAKSFESQGSRRLPIPSLLIGSTGIPSTPNLRYLIIDTDAGSDDAQCLILVDYLTRLLKAQKQIQKTGNHQIPSQSSNNINPPNPTKNTDRNSIQVIGVTCANGNTDIDNVVKNVLITLKICDTDIPVYRGCQRPLSLPHKSDFFFKRDGFGNQQQSYMTQLNHDNSITAAEEKANLNTSAAQFLVESARKYGPQLAIIAIGPLTNLGAATLLDFEAMGKVGAVSLMGGTLLGMGFNQHFGAQFNMSGDPLAAKIVFETFQTIFVSPFELSQDFALSVQQKRHLFGNTSTIKSKLIRDIFHEVSPVEHCVLCDPFAALPILIPEMITEIYNVSVSIDLGGRRTQGAMIIDWNNINNRQKNVHIIGQLNQAQVFKTMVESYQPTK